MVFRGRSNDRRELLWRVFAANRTLTDHPGESADSWAFHMSLEDSYNNSADVSYGSTAFTNGQVLGVAVDTDAGKIWFAKNNTWYNSGDPAAGTGQIFSGLTGRFASLHS
jgi:hypothetical protein